MAYTAEHYTSREEWLEHRIGIGASEIGSVMGCGFMSTLDLWKLKTGMTKKKDLSDNERVQFGNNAEDGLRALFSAIYPEYILSFEPYTILRQEGEYSYLFDTPDGLLIERGTGRRGLYESKTTTVMSKADWAKWDERVPEGYFCQICQGMFCGDLDFAVIFVLMMKADKDAEIRMYKFERKECEWKIEQIKRSAHAFWDSVQNKRMPTLSISL